MKLSRIETLSLAKSGRRTSAIFPGRRWRRRHDSSSAIPPSASLHSEPKTISSKTVLTFDLTHAAVSDRPLVAQSGRSSVRRSQLWKNKGKNSRSFLTGIFALAEPRKPTARIAFRYAALSSSNLSLKKWLAAISPFIILRASSLPAEIAWSAAASRSTEDGAEACGAASARDWPMAGSQDRRFPRAGMKNSFYINGD
jgi:hypothetical protein